MMKPDRYLMKRGDHWFYKRRIPKRFRPYDSREFIKKTLETHSLEIARLRRDALEQADNDFWAAMAFYDDETASVEMRQRVNGGLARKYQAACSRALSRGFIYAPAEKLGEVSDLAEIMDRIQIVKDVGATEPTLSHEAEAEAMLGGVSPPPVTISGAFEMYCDEIAIDELAGKSETQVAAWKKTKRRGVQYCINLIGDLDMRAISRNDGLQYYNWWKDRVFPKGNRKALSTKTANRDLGNIRKLFTEYFRHIGEEDRQNPFRNLSFKDKQAEETPPFENDWVRQKILKPGVLTALRGDAHLIAFALIETGCRPGEISNLMPEDIHLDEDVPYISICSKKNRELKTPSSIRDIPLVGISLEAMRRAPNGFPHYRDKPDLRSANLMRAFKVRNLFPTPEHNIYSFRHSFEKRMQEAELDYAFRCMIMGHRNTRPTYGDGGSMVYRRDQLLKIVHPFPGDMFAFNFADKNE